MKVKLIMQMSGPRPDSSDWPGFGGTLDVSDGEGADLIAAGIAVPVAEERAVESAAMVPDPKVEVRAEPDLVEQFADPALTGTEAEPVKRGPGRPPGSKNAPKP